MVSRRAAIALAPSDAAREDAMRRASEAREAAAASPPRASGAAARTDARGRRRSRARGRGRKGDARAANVAVLDRASPIFAFDRGDPNRDDEDARVRRSRRGRRAGGRVERRRGADVARRDDRTRDDATVFFDTRAHLREYRARSSTRDLDPRARGARAARASTPRRRAPESHATSRTRPSDRHTLARRRVVVRGRAK